jgi:hypothetical protein
MELVASLISTTSPFARKGSTLSWHSGQKFYVQKKPTAFLSKFPPQSLRQGHNFSARREIYLLTATGLTPGGSITVQYSTEQYSTVQYSTVQCSEVQYSTVQYSTVQYSTVQYSTVQCSAVKCSEVQYSAVQYSTVQYSTHLHTNSTQNNTINLGRVRSVPSLCELYPGIWLTTEEKARENLSQGSRRVPAGTMKTEYTEENVLNNKNT